MLRAELLQHRTNTARPGVPAGPGGGLSAAVGFSLSGLALACRASQLGESAAAGGQPPIKTPQPAQTGPREAPGWRAALAHASPAAGSAGQRGRG